MENVVSNEFGVGFPAEKITIKFRLLVSLALLPVWTVQAGAQFAQTEHKQIVDAGGLSGLRVSTPPHRRCSAFLPG
jgi:hypothetical protein